MHSPNVPEFKASRYQVLEKWATFLRQDRHKIPDLTDVLSKPMAIPIGTNGETMSTAFESIKQQSDPVQPDPGGDSR